MSDSQTTPLPLGSTRAFRSSLAILVPALVLGALVLADAGFDLTGRQELFLAIWWALALGLAFNVFPRAQPPSGAGLAGLGFLLLAALQISSMAWGPSADLALEDAARTIGYGGVIALAWAALGPRSWRSAAAGMVVAVSLLTLVAFAGRLAPELSIVSDAHRAIETERLFAPLGYWNALAAWAAATMAMVLAWSADARSVGMRAIALAVLPVAAGTLYLTYSRGGVVAAVVGLGLVLALTRNSRRATLHALVGAIASAFVILAIRSQPEIANGTSGEGGLTVAVCAVLAAGGCWVFATGGLSRTNRTRLDDPKRDVRPVLAVVGAILAAVVGVVLLSGGDGYGRGSDTGSIVEDDPSHRLASVEGSRSDMWNEALDGFFASPVWGEGSGSFATRWARSDTGIEQVRDAHSFPFETASELGLLGLALATLAVTGLARAALAGFGAASRNGASVSLVAATAVFLVSCAIDWTWDSAPLAFLGLGSAAVLSMAAARPSRERRRRGGTSGTPGMRFRWAAVGVAFLLGAVQVPGAVSQERLLESDQQLVLGDQREALESADEAVEAAPWSAAASAARARSLLEAGDLEGAREATSQAIDKEPEEADHLLLLALIESASMDLPAAASTLTDAIVLSPSNADLGSPGVSELFFELKQAGYGRQELVPEGIGG